MKASSSRVTEINQNPVRNWRSRKTDNLEINWRNVQIPLESQEPRSSEENLPPNSSAETLAVTFISS
jgi:hypothetical protein